uniref:RRM domain-containing protein n=1 Tax=Monodelphis domestica TaxID=13616 RepID=A0A5F8GP67_MONDO
MNAQTNRSRCFGFITFSSLSEADAAMAASPHEVDGSRVELKRAVSREDSCKPGAHARVKKIFVGGIKGDVSESDLVRHFSQFGPVEKAEIIVNKQSGKKRGFGFVHFFDHDTADKAAVIKFHPIQGHRVEVKKALPKEDLDQWNFNLPMLGSNSCTWRSSTRAHAGVSPDLSPTHTPVPAPPPTIKPEEGSKPAGWPGPKLAGWMGPKPTGWLGSKPAGWPGPESDKEPDPKAVVEVAPEPDGDDASKSIGDPPSKSDRSPDPKPDGNSAPKFDEGPIPTFAWIPTPKTGWGPDNKPGWDPVPKPVGGSAPKPDEESWAPEVKFGSDPDPKSPVDPALNTSFNPKSGSGPNPGPQVQKPKPSLLASKPNPKLGLLGPRPNPNSGLLGPRPNSGLLGPRPNSGLLGPRPYPSPGRGNGRRHSRSRGIYDQISRRGSYSSSSGYSEQNEYGTNYSQFHHRGSLGPMKKRRGVWEYQEESPRGGDIDYEDN